MYNAFSIVSMTVGERRIFDNKKFADELELWQ